MKHAIKHIHVVAARGVPTKASVRAERAAA